MGLDVEGKPLMPPTSGPVNVGSKPWNWPEPQN